MERSETSSTPPVRRPLVASGIFLYMIAANAFFLIQAIRNRQAMIAMSPGLEPVWTPYLLCPVLMLVGLVAIWNWRKWGVWLVVASIAAAQTLSYAVGNWPHARGELASGLLVAGGLFILAVKLVWNRLR